MVQTLTHGPNQASNHDKKKDEKWILHRIHTEMGLDRRYLDRRSKTHKMDRGSWIGDKIMDR